MSANLLEEPIGKVTTEKEEDSDLTASINCLTSDSESLLPSFGRPAFNSSNVIVPLLSVSMDLNISFKPIISSSERFSAITCNKIVYKLIKFIS